MIEVKENKAEIAYKTIVRKDPITNKPVNCALVESGRKVSISQILEEVSGNGHGIGKTSAFMGIYQSILSATLEHLIAGDCVTLDGFARIHCTVRGTLDQSGTISKERNSLHTVIQPLGKFRFKIDDFTWRNASAAERRIRMTSVLSCVASAQNGQITKGKDIRIYGGNLDLATEIVLTWTVDGEESSTTIQVSDAESGTLRLPWPAALNEVAAGIAVTFTVTVGEGASTQMVSRTATLMEA